MIAYDRLIPDQDIAYYVSFDNVKQGRIQAQTLLDKLGSGADGKSIVMVNGAPTDPSAGDYKKGAHQVFDKSGVKIAKEYDTPDWSPDKAQVEMEQSITALGKDGFVGVYSANDGMAGGMIAAMKGAGIDPSSRPITGGDSEAAAIQRILTASSTRRSTWRSSSRPRPRRSSRSAAAQGKDAPADSSTPRWTTAPSRLPSVLLLTDRGHEGQHQGHRDQGRLPDRRRDLHRRVHGRVQGGGNPVRTWPAASRSPAPSAPRISGPEARSCGRSAATGFWTRPRARGERCSASGRIPRSASAWRR